MLPPPEPDYLEGLFQFRTLWEGHCAEVGAPRKDAKTLAAMTTAFNSMKLVRRLGPRFREYRRFTDRDADFHQAIVDGAQNPAMSAIYARLHVIMLQSRLYLTRMKSGAPSTEVVREHAAILDAYKAGDGAAARVAITRHFEGGCRRMRVAMAHAPYDAPHEAAGRLGERGAL